MLEVAAGDPHGAHVRRASILRAVLHERVSSQGTSYVGELLGDADPPVELGCGLSNHELAIVGGPDVRQHEAPHAGVPSDTAGSGRGQVRRGTGVLLGECRFSEEQAAPRAAERTRSPGAVSAV